MRLQKKSASKGLSLQEPDVCMKTVGRVCDAMGLNGLSYEASKVAVDKMLMKSRYEEYGVRTARFRRVSFSDTDISKTIRDLNFPLIFKSVDSSGSRGIIRVNSSDEFTSSMDYVRENTRKDYFLVEEFIEGEEFGAQAFAYDGNVSSSSRTAIMFITVTPAFRSDITRRMTCLRR